MKIQSRFDVGQSVVFIENNEIVSYPVHEIEYVCRTIRYSFLVSKAINMMDKDKRVVRDEKDCFKSVHELANHYKQKNKNV